MTCVLIANYWFLAYSHYMVRKRWKNIVQAVVCLLIITAQVGAKMEVPVLKICVDNGDWRPFVYIKNEKVTGLHIDTIEAALKEMGIDFKLIPAPWKRCLKGTEKGTFDAIATASYNEERAVYMRYPHDASNLKSEFRVGQVQYNIIVHHSSDFEYTDELGYIPQPTRVPRDYSIGKDLKGMGFAIDDSSINDQQNLKRLVREKTGSVIALPYLVSWANQQDGYAGQIKLIKKPIKSKSYFLVFSKSGQVDTSLAQSIWKKIQNVRDNTQVKKLPPIDVLEN